MTGLPQRLERQARNEALFREVNERIATAGESQAETVELMCECGTEGGCGERVQMPLSAYEHVREQDDRFVVLPGHERADLEHPVESTADYVIVDKVDAAEPLVQDDPRGATSS